MPEISSPSVWPNQLFPALSGCGSISACSSRGFGNMSFSHGDTTLSLQNRKSFLEAIGLDHRRLVCAKQVHGSNIEYAGEAQAGKGALRDEDALASTDGLITDQRQLPLAIFTADCLPVFLLDPALPAVGLIHAGRRSTRQRIVFKALQLMRQRFNTRPEEVLAAFGPAIRSCCYELEKGSAEGLVQRGSRYYFDLAAANREQLLSCGVKEEGIFDCRACTCCGGKEFFSYRRQGQDCGRMLSVIMLR